MPIELLQSVSPEHNDIQHVIPQNDGSFLSLDTSDAAEICNEN